MFETCQIHANEMKGMSGRVRTWYATTSPIFLPLKKKKNKLEILCVCAFFSLFFNTVLQDVRVSLWDTRYTASFVTRG